MMLFALSLLVAVHTQALPEPTIDVVPPPPATAPQGVFEPPPIPPRIASGSASLPPDPPDPYPSTTRMRRIARTMLASILIGSGTALVLHANDTTARVVGMSTISLGVTTACLD